MESNLVIELHTACTRGDLDNVKRLIELGASPWIHDDQGNTLFHLCCSSVQCGLEVLEYLTSVSDIVDYSALINNKGSTLLHLACNTGKLEFVRFLFSQHQDRFVLYHDVDGHTPLYYACKNQHSDIALFICRQNVSLSPDDIYQCAKISTLEVRVLLLKKISFKDLMDREIKEGLIDLAKLVVQNNIVQRLDNKQLYPLHYFAALGDEYIVDFLITKVGSKQERKLSDGSRPLHIACKYPANINIVRYLVEKAGCYISAERLDKTTSLHIACQSNCFEIVKFLSSKDECNIEAEDKDGTRPLHLACEHSNNVMLVKYLVEEAGCDINAKRSRDDATSLHIACQVNQLDIVKFLTSNPQCDKEAKHKHDDRPLHIVCETSDNVELVRHLVEVAGCEINAKGYDGFTPLHYACQKNHFHTVKFLASKPKCDKDSENNDGDRPLHIACKYSGNDVNNKGHNNIMPAHNAFDNNKLNIVKFLISELKYDVEVENKNGDRPLHLASRDSRNIQLVKYLVEAVRCDTNAQNIHGDTPLITAYKHHAWEIFDYFRYSCDRQLSSTSDDDKLFLENYEQALKSSEVVHLRNVKFVLTGPPGAGKSTLLRRLLNENFTEPCLSTGVMNETIPVEQFRKLHEQGVIVSGVKDVIDWKRQSKNEEAAFIFNKISDSSENNSEKIVQKKSQEFYGNGFNPEKNDKINEKIEECSNSYETIIFSNSTTTELNDFDQKSIENDDFTSSSTEKAIQTISGACRHGFLIKNHKTQEIIEDSHAMLHVIDTGGQPEFHEILPILITGPAVNLVVFKLNVELSEHLMIVYRSNKGQSEPYETCFTHEEVIFRSLASIACLRHSTFGWDFDKLPIKDSSEPAAFLIATHRDCVDKSKVSKVNEELSLKIQNSSDLFHDNLVQFSKKEQAIFPLDTINDQEQIEHLRISLHTVISRFQELPIPVSWCAFSLKLKESKNFIYKVEKCYELAQGCGIKDRDDFKSVLWFLHHRVGSIMHYPGVKELENIVIIDLQQLFDRITQLITSSFTFEATKSAAIATEFCTTGQFTEKHIRKLSFRKDDPLTPSRLVSLLKHLHIVVGFTETKGGHKTENYYFMPCALKPTAVEVDHRDQSISPPPLLIYFECGYNPVGVFCCLVVYLLSSTSQSGLEWTLEKPPHYRNKITFSVGQCFDHITLIGRATYLEVWIDRIAGITGAIPLEEFCPTIYDTLNNGIKTVTESLHYTYRSKHFFGFPCTTCQSSHPHPAICKYDNPVAAKCVNGRSVMPLEEKHKIWFDKVKPLSQLCISND